MSDQFILSVDQGTTSSRALAFDKAGQVRRWRSASSDKFSPMMAG